MKHKTFSILLAVLMSMAASVASAYDAEVDGIYYNFSENEATVTYLGLNADNESAYSGDVTIPETVTCDGKTYSVTQIGYAAFNTCTNLTSVSIPNSVTSIGTYAFYECTGLKALTIPESVTSIGSYAFYDCWALESIVVENGNTVYDSRNNCNALIETASNTLIAGCNNTIIPEGITSIGDYAFQYSDITSVTIPQSVTSIGNGAFYGCGGLESIVVENGNTVYDSRNNCNAIIETASNTLILGSNNAVIPEGVTSIGYGAFLQCTGLTSVTIPNSVTEIGERAFYYCTGLTSVTIPNSVTKIGEYAFTNCRGLTSVTIPNGVTEIGDYVFVYCTGLTSVTIPNSVTKIGKRAFCWCESLTSIVIPNSVTEIGEYAFGWCSSLSSVTISESMTSIGEAAFCNCSSLISVTIPNSVTSIGKWTFASCTSLTTVTIPESVTSIGAFSFASCSGLTSIVVESGNPMYDSRGNCNAIIETTSNTLIAGCMNTTIPYGVTSIGEEAFNCCAGLTSVTIPESVTSIVQSAFYGCTGLTSITIPENVTNIGERAFENCTGLTSISVLRKEPISINENTFRVYAGRDEAGNTIWSNNIYESATLYVPFNSKQAYAETQGWSLFKNIEGIGYADDQGIIYALGEDNQYAVVGHTENLKSEIVIASEVDGLPVTSIGEEAFYRCTGLTFVTIPNSVTEIGYSAFRGCTGITSVTIPESVTCINEEAFYGCKLRNVYVKSATPPILDPDYNDEWGEYEDDEAADVFGEITCYHGILYVPTGAWEAYAFDSGWWPFINIREAATEQQEVKDDVSYTLMDAKTFQYAVYDPVNNRVRMIQSVNVDESDPYHCWQTVEVNGKQFLYNIGAKKFAVPSTDDSSFTLSDDVRSITMTDGNDGLVLNGHAETQWALVVNEKMSMDNGVEDVVVTAIEGINANDNFNLNEIYDLNGRQITKPTKGINIKNGKKILVK